MAYALLVERKARYDDIICKNANKVKLKTIVEILTTISGVAEREKEKKKTRRRSNRRLVMTGNGNKINICLNNQSARRAFTAMTK
jgi:hypothetical protein